MSARLASLRLFVALLCGPAGLVAPGIGAQEQSGPAPGTRYFLSNPLGMALEEIGWYRRDEATFVLARSGDADLETRTLFREGVELKRWERSAERERVYEQGQLVEESLFDRNGRVREMREFEAGLLVGRRVYEYPRSGEIRARTYDADGNLLHADRSLLSAQHSLRETRRETSSGEGARLSLSSSGDRLVEERTTAGERTLISRYDSLGRLRVRERWSEAGLVERETLEYREDTGVPASSVTRDMPAGRTTYRSFDREGRLEEVEIEEDGQIVEQTRHERDGDGREILTVRNGPLGLEQWRYDYDQEGEPVREEYRRRGALVRVTLYEGPGLRVEELYRGGEAFVRVTYQDGEKIREQFLKDGAVVRTREYR